MAVIPCPMAKAFPNRETHALTHQRVAWTSSPADYDIVAQDPAAQVIEGEQWGRMARRIDVMTPGTLVVVGPDDTEVTLPAATGSWSWIGWFKAIKSTSTAQGVVVGW